MLRSWDSGNKVEVHTALILIKGKLEGLKAEEWSKRSGIPFQHIGTDIDRRETWSSTSKTRAQNTFTLFFTLPMSVAEMAKTKEQMKWVMNESCQMLSTCVYQSFMGSSRRQTGRRGVCQCVNLSCENETKNGGGQREIWGRLIVSLYGHQARRAQQKRGRQKGRALANKRGKHVM